MVSDMFMWPASPSGLRQPPPFSQPLFTFIYTQLFIDAQFGDYAQGAGVCPGDADGGWGGAEDGESRLGRGSTRSLGKTTGVGHVPLRGEGAGWAAFRLPLASWA